MSQEDLKAAYNLMRRMPPSQTTKSLAGVITLAPELTEELLANVDQPLQVSKDPKTGKEYILCDYNRDGDAHRSPWSNTYFEGGEETDGVLPSAPLRALEIEANKVFDVYRHMYFDTGLSSVYFFEDEEPGAFGAAFLIHKEVAASASLRKGWWDSTHVFNVKPVAGSAGAEFEYTLTSTVLVSMNLQEEATGTVDLSGSMVQQTVKSKKVDKVNTHIVNLGTMLEQMESALRNRLEGSFPASRLLFFLVFLPCALRPTA